MNFHGKTDWRKGRIILPNTQNSMEINKTEKETGLAKVILCSNKQIAC